MIVKAIALTNSLDDTYHRVRVSSDEFWVQSPLFMVVDNVSIVKGDTVLVDISQGSECGVIIGKCKDSNYQTNSKISGLVIFESSDGSSWAVQSVKGSTVEFRNSSGASMLVSGSKIIFNDGMLGGVPVVSKVNTNFNNIISSLNSLKNLLSMWSPKGKISDSVELKAILLGWINASISLTSISDLEDPNLIH